MRFGGRWNPRETFAALYLNETVDVARANGRRILTSKLERTPITADDLESSELPVLVTTTITEDDFLDVLSAEGCEAVGLPTSYPLDGSGSVVGWNECQPIGFDAYEAGLGGVACPSAARDAPTGGEELARFERNSDAALEVIAVTPFAEWYGPFDW
jgi:RES domain-containing protein